MPDKLKVIIDTNLWLNYLITSRLVDLDPFFKDERLLLIFSNELLEEFIEVAQRPRFRKYFGEERIAELLLQFETFGFFANVASEVDACRDAKDNFLLALAQDANADYLVTKDDDLLVLGSFGETRILDYFGFLDVLRKNYPR